MKKRMVSVLLCVVLMLGAVPLLGVPAQAITYRITYNQNTSNTVENMPETTTGGPDDLIGIAEEVPIRFRYTFLGWSTSKNATEAEDVEYIPGEDIVLSSNLTLYAVWQYYTKFGALTGYELDLAGEVGSMAEIAFSGQQKWYRVKPTQSTSYTFWSTGGYDPNVTLYDSSGTQLGTNDDNPYTTNDFSYRLSYSLESGSTYYIAVSGRTYSGGDNIWSWGYPGSNYRTVTYYTNIPGNNDIYMTQRQYNSVTSDVPWQTPDYDNHNFLGWATSTTDWTYDDLLLPGESLPEYKTFSLYAIWTENYTIRAGATQVWNGSLEYGTKREYYSFKPLKDGYYGIHVEEFITDDAVQPLASISVYDSSGNYATYIDGNYDWSEHSWVEWYDLYKGKTYTICITNYIENTIPLFKEYDETLDYFYYDNVGYFLWVGNGGTLTYDANGGTNAPAAQHYRSDYTVSSSIPTRSGYKFSGWSTSKTPTDNDLYYDPGDPLYLNYDVTLYAQWTKITTHTVTYNYSYNGGSSATKTNATVEEGASIDLTPTATKSGWTFVGWNTDPSATSKMTSLKMGTSNVTLYAIFKKTITGTFIDYSGTTKKTTIKTVDIYNKATSGYLVAPTQNTYTGWTARGWTTSTSANASYTSSFSVSSDTTYYGLYQRTLTLSYNANGGSSTPSSQSGTQYVNSYSISTYSNPSFTLANAISKSGATFGGWKKGSTSGTLYSAGSSISISDSTTMYAYWNPVNNYTVTFDAQGGSVSPSSRTVTSGTIITLPTPSKSYTITFNANGGSASTSSNMVYCSFRNWNTYSSGSGSSYSAGSNYTVNANTTFYAQWTNPTAGSLPSASRGGYTFDGWYTSSSGGSRITSSSTISANTTLYAHWSYIPVTAVGCDVISAPKKTSYIYKENTDISGIVLNIRYSDGSTKTVSDTSKMTFTGLTTASVGTVTVGVTCEGVSSSFNITVRYAWWQRLIRIFLLGFLWY